MEDLSRNLPQGSQLRSPSRTREASKHWRVFLIGDLGKIVSFSLTKPLLVASTTCLAAVLAVVIYSVVSYNLVRLENRHFRKDLDALRAKLETAEKDREKALVRMMVLEDSVKQVAKKPSPASDRETKDVASKQTKPSPAAVASLPTRPEKDRTAAPASSARILVKDLEIWREPESNAFKFQFVLKNRNIDSEGDNERNRIAGHTFVVLGPEEGSGTTPRTFPWTPLKDGKPGIFKRGQYFSIVRFKFVRGTLRDVGEINRFKTATIYVYSDTGDLLMGKVFEVARILRSQG